MHVEEPGLSGLLAEAALGAGGTGQLRLEFFNVWESVPPTVLDEFPPGDHLLVAGAGPLGQALVMHAARRQAGAGRRLQATLVGPGADAAGRELTDRYPRLAELEHERWCRERTAEGWTAGPTRDDERKVTPYLVDWDQLPEDVKDYDRNAVRALPELLTFAGYEIVRVR